MKKLKRKRITRAKNAGTSNPRILVKNFRFSDNQLRIITLVSSLLSIYKSAKELGWLHRLPELWEKLSTILIFLF